jgi:hypothetical protein
VMVPAWVATTNAVPVLQGIAQVAVVTDEHRILPG